MRTVHVIVATEQRREARKALEANEFTLVELPVVDRDAVLFEVPVPSDAVGDVLATLEGASVDLEEYTVIGSAESAKTATAEALERSYAGNYDPLTTIELRTKARDLSRDPATYSALMVLSALIATAGILVNSPAIIVGAMVIAPIIGPALTASVGTVTGDPKMITDSLWMQLYGIVLAIGAAAMLGLGVRYGGIVPSQLDLPALDLFGVRLAPNALSLIVGISAGIAAGIALTTKGPTAIIGVMIAAALIPTAAASGIAIAWGEPALAIGTTVLLVVTLISINLAVLGVLLALGYHQKSRATIPEGSRSIVYPALLLVVVLILTLGVVGATAQQVVVDRQVQQSVNETAADPTFEQLTVIGVQTEYNDMSPFTGPRTVTVIVSETGDAPTEAFARAVRDRIIEKTGEEMTVKVERVAVEVVSEEDTHDETASALEFTPGSVPFVNL